MRQRYLRPREVLRGLRAVGKLYATIPPLLLWRAWEWAAYRHYRLPEPVLDLGSGDGRFFHLAWPRIQKVLGLDIDPQMCIRARSARVYQSVVQASALYLPFPQHTFASVFSNCAVEHMGEPPQVFAEVYRILRPGGVFLGSVVTDKLEAWRMIPTLLRWLGISKLGEMFWQQYRAYHRYTRLYSSEMWIYFLHQAGFTIEEVVPLLPERVARAFLLLDELWHIPGGIDVTAFGQQVHRYLQSIPNPVQVAADIVRGLLRLDPPPYQGAGLVFYARKPRG